MNNIEELTIKFDRLIPIYNQNLVKPNDSSIKKIETHFGFKLPESFIEFAKKSNSFSSFFSSLGNDYKNISHIIRINSYWRNRRKTRAIPKNLIIFTLGYDEDFYCFDLDNFDPIKNEYQIQYWSPNVNDGKKFLDFIEYLENQVYFWENNKK
ncbi:MAG: SMI1/KNR4 family protein [Candidatus Sericytochromatia bacterium]